MANPSASPSHSSALRSSSQSPTSSSQSPRSSESWSTANVAALIPSQAGRRILITGANSGIGYPAARELARAGAHILLGSRDRARGEKAIALLRSEVPQANVELSVFDLASLASLKDFAARELDRGLPLDVLIDNAGVMAPPKRLETRDGFELQFGTNVLGHFALTGLLFPLVEKAVTASSAALPQVPRVVVLASIAHKRAVLQFDDLQSTRSYNPMKAYQQTKLADLMLAFELDRRLRAKASPILSIAAHPGVANTNLFQVGDFNPIEKGIRKVMGPVIGALLNSVFEGALPTIFAAVAPNAETGGYYGPQGLAEMRGGDVGNAVVAPQARDTAAAARLWAVCEDLTGVRFL